MTHLDIPIINIELQHMKQTLQIAIFDHQERMKEATKYIVDKFFEEKNIQEIIEKQLLYEVEELIKTELKNYVWLIMQKKRTKIMEMIKNNIDKSLIDENKD
jgi:hypothetical protein